MLIQNASNDILGITNSKEEEKNLQNFSNVGIENRHSSPNIYNDALINIQNPLLDDNNSELSFSQISTDDQIHLDLNNRSEVPLSVLNDLKRSNFDRLIIGHLNVNSLRNKFEALKNVVTNKVDILLVSETKLDETFPTNQFFIEGYSQPFRLDKNALSGGIMIYIRNDIPCKILNKHSLPNDIEGLFIEITLRKRKWILFGGYNPLKVRISYFLEHVGKSLDKYLGDYDNVLLLGDFNSEVVEKSMKEFCGIYNLQNLIKEPTCYKNINNPSSIDVILTNRCMSFGKSQAIETGISDFHKMTVTVLKTFYQKKSQLL